MRAIDPGNTVTDRDFPRQTFSHFRDCNDLTSVQGGVITQMGALPHEADTDKTQFYRHGFSTP